MKQSRVSQILLLMSAALCACSAPQQEKGSTSRPSYLNFDYGQPEGMTRAEYAGYLKGEAAKLAESELARLSAIELVYRNELYYHSFNIPGTYSKGGAYVKMYRQFTEYAIIDITHPISLLHPIFVTIEFNYDIIATDPILVDSEDMEAAQTARNRGNPVYFRSGSVRRFYRCDEMGVPESPLPAPPKRPNYWDQGRSQSVVFSLHAVPETRKNARSKPRKTTPKRRRTKP